MLFVSWEEEEPEQEEDEEQDQEQEQEQEPEQKQQKCSFHFSAFTTFLGKSFLTYWYINYWGNN